jgi:hypothetical protein
MRGAMRPVGTVAVDENGDRGMEKRRCLRMPPGPHPEPGVQVGEGSLALGSSNAR